MTNLRSVAILGIGLVGLAGASLGFIDEGQAPEQPAVVEQARPSSSGSAYYDTGKAHVWKDHAWVKAVKWGVSGGRPLDFTTLQKAGGNVALPVPARAAALGCGVTVSAGVTVAQQRISAIAYNSLVESTSNAEVGLPMTSATTSRARVDWLSADELILILETMG